MSESGEVPKEIGEEYRRILRAEGLASALHYLVRQYPGSGNYTEDRHAWLDHLTLEEIFAEARRRFPPAAP